MVTSRQLSVPSSPAVPLVIVLLATAFAVQPGCASSDEEATAVQAETSWIQPACTVAALLPPSANACNGPWAFSYHESWVCGEDTTQSCVQYKTCISWDKNVVGDGLGVVQTDSSETVLGSQSCPARGCRTSVDSRCQTAAANRADALRQTIDPGAPAWAVNALEVTQHSSITSTESDPDILGNTIFHYKCDLAIHKFPTQETDARPACSCAQYPPLICTHDDVVVTPPGQTRPDPGVPIHPGGTRTFTLGPTCLTCDEQAVDTDAGAQGKFDCLDHQLATATGDLKSSVAARLKLLLQVAGERLTPTQRARAEAVYNEHLSASTACSTAVTWDASCPADSSSTHLITQSQLCNDLVTNPSTAPGAAGAELTHCLAQLTALGETAATCQLAMRDSVDATVQAVLERAQPSFAGDNFVTTLPLALARIAAWWQSASALAGTNKTWFLGQSSALHRWLWSTIEAQRTPMPNQPPADDAAAAKLLADLSRDRLTNDLSVLRFAYAPGQPVSAPPLLTITSDALQSLSDRLQRLEPIHDVGCRFKPCLDGNMLTATATSELVHALAVLPDAAAFRSALAGASKLQTQYIEVYDALSKIGEQHVYLETAWSLYGRPEPFSSLAVVSDPPLEAAGLVAIVRSASQAWASYQATGEFLPWNRPRVTASTLNQHDLADFINRLTGDAGAARANYADSRLKLTNDVLSLIANNKTTQSENDQLEQQIMHLRDIASRMDGLLQRDRTELSALGGFQAEFEALVNSDAVNPDAEYHIDAIPVFNASASDSYYPNTESRDIVRDSFHTETLTSGQILRVHITGDWSPMCAITNGNLLDSNTGLLFPIIAGEARTGPEGYLVTASLTGFSTMSLGVFGSGVTDHTVVTCATSALDFGLCSQANNPGDGRAGSVSIGIGNEVRSSAAFNAGLRLSTTPYPNAPAGSLVAVLTRRGVTGGPSDPPVLDIRVVNRDDIITAPTPPHVEGWPDDGQIEVHFVVNDRAFNPDGSACARPVTSALTIELHRSTPVGRVAEPLGNAMSDALGAIEDQSDSVIAQGALSATEAGALRSEAWVKVEDRLSPLGIGLSGLPQELHQLFDSHIERELASIDRRAQYNALRQEHAQVSLQIDALKRQQGLSQEQDRLLHLIPRWRLRDLSGVTLSRTAAALAETLTSHAAPIFELRDPASSTNFVYQVSEQSDALTKDLDMKKSYDEIVDDLVSFASATVTAIRDAEFELPSTQRRTIIIAIPRPPGPGHAAWTGPWQAVSIVTQNAFWNSAVDVNGDPLPDATLTLLPADIYLPAGGPSRLNCGDLAPVVRHIGFYFATDGISSSINGSNINIKTLAAVSSPLTFPLLGRVASLEWTDPRGIPMDVRALSGATTQVLVDSFGNPANFGVWPADLDAGAGISPFTSFHLNMQAFTADVRATLRGTKAMFVVLDVERRISNQDIWLPGVCASE